MSATPPDDFLPPTCGRARVTEDSNVCTTAQERQQRKALDEAMVRATFGFQRGRRCEPTGRMVHNQRGLWGLDQCAECEPGPAGRCRQWVELTSVDVEEPAPPAGGSPAHRRLRRGRDRRRGEEAGPGE